MKEIIIKRGSDIELVKILLSNIPIDGNTVVQIKSTKTSSLAKQRSLTWRWMKEIKRSGMEGDRDKEEIYTRMKWRFALPIMLRDSDIFRIVYNSFIKSIEGSLEYKKYCKLFTESYISTDKMNKEQREEYLNNVKSYWKEKGLSLSPSNIYTLC